MLQEMMYFNFIVKRLKVQKDRVRIKMEISQSMTCLIAHQRSVVDM